MKRILINGDANASHMPPSTGYYGGSVGAQLSQQIHMSEAEAEELLAEIDEDLIDNTGHIDY